MTSRIAKLGRAKRSGAFAVVGALSAILMSPEPLFAESVGAIAPQTESFATASVNASAAPETFQAVSAAEAPTAERTGPPAFDMSSVERIRIRMWGHSDLSGEYAVEPDNSLSIPRVGRIEVGGMTLAGLEDLLAQKLGAALRTDITVAVEVARFRPYYIMGHVAEAGAIEWRPGLKVIQAISLARGVLRAEGTGLVASRQSRTQLTFALAQLARLKAEREGGDVVATNDRIATLISSVPETSRMALTNLISRQNDLLSDQRRVMDAQIVGLRRERETAGRELAGAEAQEKSVREQIEITRAQLASIEDLKERKLVNNARYLQQKSDLLMVEIRYSEIKSIVERARARLSSIDQQLVTLPQQRRAELGERIEALEREVAQLELVVGLSSGVGEDQENVLRLGYHISRESASGVRTFPATVFTEVLPGDVLIVSEGQDRLGAEATDAMERPSLGQEKDASAEEAQRRIEDAAVAPGRHFLRHTSEGTYR